MPRPRKLTAEQVAQLRQVMAERRALVAALRAVPSLEQLAELWCVSVSALKQASSGRTYRELSD